MKQIVLKLIRFYQLFISSNLEQNCRFYPSCSEYNYQAITKYGLFRGCGKGFKRMLKCHPYHSGGVDLP